MRLASRMLLAACLAACGGDDGGDGGGGSADARPGSDGAPDEADAGGSRSLTLTTWIGGEQAPLRWVARQDGDGPWEAITSTDGVYLIELERARFGLAYVCELGTDRHLNFFHATTGDLTELDRACPASTAPATGTLSFQVTGLDDNATAIVFMGNGSALATMADDTVDMELRAGDWDFVTTVKPNDITINRAAITPGTILDGETTTIQLGALADTVAVESFEATVTGVDPAGAVVSARLATAGGTTASLDQPVEGRYATLPLAALRAGDIHVVSARAVADGLTRDVRTFLRAGADVTLQLPIGFDPDVTAAASDPVILLQATFEGWPDAEVYWLEASQGSDAGDHRFSWIASRDWLAGAADPGTWTQPDLSSVSGWSDDWGMDPAEEFGWSLQAVKATGDRYPLELFDRAGRPAAAPPAAAWDGEVIARAGRAVLVGPQ